MTRRRYVWNAETKEFVERIRRPRSSIEIITDQIDQMYCHADGQWYDSRSAYNEGLKRAGVYVPIEGEKIRPPEDTSGKDIEHDLQMARRDLTWGNAELTEEERHICKEYNERFRRR